MATVGRGRFGEDYGHGRGEIFPELWAFVVAGTIVGAVAAGLVVELVEPGHGSLPARALGAGLGAILGLFAGLGRGVWRLGQPLPVRQSQPEPPRAADPSPQLWDPWLDTGRDLEWVSSEPVP